MRRPARAVRIQGAGDPVGLEYRPQRGHDRRRALAAGDELGIEQPFGRTVDDPQQGQRLAGPQGQPAVAAAVEVQQFPEARPRLAPAPMAAARPPFGHQARRLQRLLDERVGHRAPVLTPQLAVEVAHIEPGVAVAGPIPVAIQLEDPLHLRQRDRPRGGPPAPVVDEAVVPIPLIPQPQPPHRPGADAQHIGHLQPALPPTQRPQDHFLHLHGPLHGGLGVGHGHLLGPHDTPPARWKRSDHLLSGAVR